MMLSGGQNSEEGLNDKEALRCPICLNPPRRRQQAVPDCCSHVYCSSCILRWAQMVQSCPVDRRPFNVIYLLGSPQRCIMSDSFRNSGMFVESDLSLRKAQAAKAQPATALH
ncbi:hypothetical protein DNTS_016563 [Danionella cerebrum]|uniref:RING-type domain-containing protein n=1 Tax=Danionella cerebrum TaxID=2873325 RepID=A0A553NRY1_9TELE|nr:hypothetical protein DNTS_016563 [Danionella translucida]